MKGKRTLKNLWKWTGVCGMVLVMVALTTGMTAAQEGKTFEGVLIRVETTNPASEMQDSCNFKVLLSPIAELPALPSTRNPSFELRFRDVRYIGIPRFLPA